MEPLKLDQDTLVKRMSLLCRPPQNPKALTASVYRLQMNREFTFKAALKVLDYLEKIGIQAVYLSPIFQAVPGSMHGYNITCPNKINPEIGTEEEFYAFSDSLKKRGMGLILDVVPNHMGWHDTNLWWRDVLENGQASAFAHFFDIDWEPIKKELLGKVLLPVLGDQYGLVLEKGEIQLEYFEGGFFFRYFDKTFPASPETWGRILEETRSSLAETLATAASDLQDYDRVLSILRGLPSRGPLTAEKREARGRDKEKARRELCELVRRCPDIQKALRERLISYKGRPGQAASFDPLHALLEEQSYRLAYWKVAAEEINYRRFFDINELVAIRMEDPDVFNKTHQLTYELILQDRVQGLRIDHPDGLYDPADYFFKLQVTYLRLKMKALFPGEPEAGDREIQEALETLMAQNRAAFYPPLYVTVEKILDRSEELPAEWAVHGTVGYEYLNALNGLFVDRRQESDFTRCYDEFIGSSMDYERLVYDKKKYFAAFNMPSELNTLAHHINLISERIRHCRDFTIGNLTTALREVIACFPVYRSYIRPEDPHVSERDKRTIQIAIDRARRRHPALSQGIFNFLRQVLLGKYEHACTDDERRHFREFVMKFQQLTSPIMAKGLEDTAFYVYNRLISLNEVGGDPTHFGCRPEEFHQQNRLRAERGPYGFLATSTHDTKRSEDLRMRLNVLSEDAGAWREILSVFSVSAAAFRGATAEGIWPEKNTEYFIYQTLLGVWPLNEKEPAPELKERIQAYFVKAMREAKTHSNWLNPNEEYEACVLAFLDQLLEAPATHPFWQAFHPFQQKVSVLGMWGAFSAMILKMASPGIVDCYQGTMSWDYSLVDPDNRRPVDFESRTELLSQIQSRGALERGSHEKFGEFVKNKEDGRIKMYLSWKCLALRKRYAELFLQGEYWAIEVVGDRAEHVIAFARRYRDSILIAAAGRFFSKLPTPANGVPAGTGTWGNTRLRLPDALKGGIKRGTEIISGGQVAIHSENGSDTILLSELFSVFSAGWVTNLTLD